MEHYFPDSFSITKAAIKHETNRQYIYRSKRRYDGSIESLRDLSRRPHHHPNQHTPDEIRLISNMRRRNPHAGLVVFWVKLSRRGYSRSITGLYRLLKRRGIMAVHPPNLKYIPKPYEQMHYPGQRIQVDVKFVPSACLVNSKVMGKRFFQYTAIDEYSRWRYVEAFEEHSTYSSAMFVEHLVKAFPFPIECLQTDNGPEFTNRFTTHRDKPTLFEEHLKRHGIQRKLISHIFQDTTGMWSAATRRTRNGFTPLIVSILFKILQNSLRYTIPENMAISLCFL